MCVGNVLAICWEYVADAHFVEIHCWQACGGNVLAMGHSENMLVRICW